MVRLTDMTLAVYCGRKTTTQHTVENHDFLKHSLFKFISKQFDCLFNVMIEYKVPMF